MLTLVLLRWLAVSSLVIGPRRLIPHVSVVILTRLLTGSGSCAPHPALERVSPATPNGVSAAMHAAWNTLTFDWVSGTIAVTFTATAKKACRRGR
jgi:hypothetical protein